MKNLCVLCLQNDWAAREPLYLMPNECNMFRPHAKNSAHLQNCAEKDDSILIHTNFGALQFKYSAV